MTLHAAVAGNLHLLRQAGDVLTQLPEGAYAAPHPTVCATGIGGMTRHLLDFYGCFLAGLPHGRVDYDARARDAALARDALAAQRRLADVAVALEHLAAEGRDAPLMVRAEDVSGTAAEWAHSSVLRELRFLISHTVHHLALMAPMMRASGVEPPEGFGVAPSTLAHQDAARAR